GQLRASYICIPHICGLVILRELSRCELPSIRAHQQAHVYEESVRHDHGHARHADDRASLLVCYRPALGIGGSNERTQRLQLLFAAQSIRRQRMRWFAFLWIAEWHTLARTVFCCFGLCDLDRKSTRLNSSH